VGGDKEAGVSAEDGQECGYLGVRMGLRKKFRLGLMRDDVTRVGCGGLES
jgi:hypothetical protein